MHKGHTYSGKRDCRKCDHELSAEHEAIIGIDDGDILEGSLPRSKMKLVQAWIEIHRDDLLANWKMAVEGQQPFKIDPLR